MRGATRIRESAVSNWESRNTSLPCFRMSLASTFCPPAFGAQVQPRLGLEGNELFRADPGEAIHGATPLNNERVVRVVQQDGGKTRYCLVEGNGREVASFGSHQPVGRATEQLDHCRKACVGGLLEPIENGFSCFTGLLNFVATALDESPEGCSELRIQNLDMENHVEILRCSKIESDLFHGQGGCCAPDQDVLICNSREVFAE